MNPLYGIEPAIMEDDYELEGPASGNLAISNSWPGQMRTIYNDHARFLETYFAEYPVTISQVMARSVMKMVITGLQGVLMMFQCLGHTWHG